MHFFVFSGCKSMLEKQKMCTSIRKPARDRNVRGVNYNRKLDELNKKKIECGLKNYKAINNLWYFLLRLIPPSSLNPEIRCKAAIQVSYLYSYTEQHLYFSWRIYAQDKEYFSSGVQLLAVSLLKKQQQFHVQLECNCGRLIAVF